VSMWLLPKLIILTHESDPGMEGFDIFKLAISVGAVLSFTAAMVALTLPWARLRKRRGRSWRLGIGCVFVGLASLGFAGRGHSVIADLAFAAWLAYTVSYTFVRYGLLDQVSRRRSSSARSASST
jgi:drug/metabolite transporter (DMT)-like permease